jgi:uncharacterized repeat protein (TIGR01451 family)
MTTCNIDARLLLDLSNNTSLVFAQIGSKGESHVYNNPVLQSISIKDGLAPIENGFPLNQLYATGNPSLQFVCVDDLGNWYNEGADDFFIPETENVTVDPGVAVTYYCNFTPGGGYNTLNGTVHYDCNNTNLPLDNADITLNYNGAASQPDADGNFTFYSASGGTLTPGFGNSYFTVSPASFVADFTGTNQIQTVDFCVSANGVHPDLTVSIFPVTVARPGFDATYKVVYTNQGTEVQSGTVNLSFADDLTDFVSASPLTTSQTANILSWNFSDLAPFESREITLTLNINSPLETPAVNISDVLDFNVSLVTDQTDETPSDNSNNLAQIVVGSFDPNDKAVSRAAIAPSQLDQYLYYTVRFQNTGTFEAENVVVRDLLSDNLAIGSLEIVAASHSCRTLVTPQSFDTPGNKLEIFFDGINLPAEQNNEPASHGFVTYKIKPKNDLVINDVIENSAGIYFDYNAAIVTNTVTTTVTALGVTDVAQYIFSLYPNPANDSMTIQLQQHMPVGTIAIFNLLGQKVKTISPLFDNGVMTIDVSDLNSGTYFIQLQSGNGKTTKKLIKT